MKDDARIKEVVRSLAQEFGIDALPEDKRESLLEKVADSLAKRVFLVTIEKLGEDGSKRYQELLDAEASEEEIRAFLFERIPEYDQVVKKEVEELKDLMKSASEALQNNQE